jgi:hypothetical protein
MVWRLALVLLCIAISPLRAETVRVNVGGAPVRLVLPAGHCALERRNAVDRQVIQNVERVTRGSNRVLVAFVECGQRAEMRAGRRTVLDDYGQYMTPTRGGRIDMAPAAFAQRMTEELKSKGAELIQGAEADTRERIAGMKLGVRMGESRVLGVLRTDERASYLGIVQNLSLPDGTAKLQVGVSAFGLQNNRMVSLNLYARFDEGAGGANTTLRLLEESTRTYTATSDANAR